MTPTPDPSRRWLVVRVPAPPRGEEHLLVEALLRVGARRIEREAAGGRGRFVARLPPTDAGVEAALRDVEVAVRAATSLGGVDLDWEWVEGGPADLEEVEVHPTTRSCLAFLEELVRPGDRWADVGAGLGVLALAAARRGAAEVLALEMDPVAVELARERVAREGLEARIRVEARRVGPGDLRRLGPFDGIVANLEAGVLLELLRETPSLRGRGRLVLSGAHRGEGRELAARASELGFDRLGERVEDGWWTGAFGRGVSTA